MTDPVTTPPPTGQGLTERLAAALCHEYHPMRWDVAYGNRNKPCGACRIHAATLAPLVAEEVAAAEAEALREAASELAAATEGPLRVGTRLWPECDRDAYSLAIEEARSALRARADRLAATTDGGQS